MTEASKVIRQIVEDLPEGEASRWGFDQCRVVAVEGDLYLAAARCEHGEDPTGTSRACWISLVDPMVGLALADLIDQLHSINRLPKRATDALRNLEDSILRK